MSDANPTDGIPHMNTMWLALGCDITYKILPELHYRVTHHLDSYIYCVSLNLGVPLAGLAPPAASYCPSRLGEHPKLMPT